MRTTLYFAIVIVALAVAGCRSTKVSNTRDLAYEQYCDSIWENNPDYYLDVVCESDEYCEYLEINGKWW